MSDTCTTSVLIEVHSWTCLRKHVHDVTGRVPDGKEELVELAVVELPKSPADHACQFLAPAGIQVSAIRDDRRPNAELFLVAITVVVDDAAIMIAEATELGRRNGMDPDWVPDASEAVFEIFVASNSYPAPMDCGFEIWN